MLTEALLSLVIVLRPLTSLVYTKSMLHTLHRSLLQNLKYRAEKGPSWIFLHLPISLILNGGNSHTNLLLPFPLSVTFLLFPTVS